MQVWKRWGLGLWILGMLGAGCEESVPSEKGSAVQSLSKCTEGSCGIGYVCVDGTCQLGCREGTNTCGENYVCVAGACRPGCSVAAPGNNTCGGNGYVCVGDNGSTTVNDPGTCKPGCNGPNDCPSASPTCVPSPQPGALGSCYAADCQVGRTPCENIGTGTDIRARTCVGIISQTDGFAGVCRILCRVDDTIAGGYPCPSGQTCRGAYGEAPYSPGICGPQ